MIELGRIHIDCPGCKTPMQLVLVHHEHDPNPDPTLDPEHPDPACAFMDKDTFNRWLLAELKRPPYKLLKKLRKATNQARLRGTMRDRPKS